MKTDEIQRITNAKRLDGPDLEAARGLVADRYAAGASIRDIAAHYGWSYGKTHRLVLASGVEVRPRGGYHR